MPSLTKASSNPSTSRHPDAPTEYPALTKLKAAGIVALAKGRLAHASPLLPSSPTVSAASSVSSSFSSVSDDAIHYLACEPHARYYVASTSRRPLQLARAVAGVCTCRL